MSIYIFQVSRHTASLYDLTRGAIVIGTHYAHKTPYILIVLLGEFGPDYYSPPPVMVLFCHLAEAV